MTKLTEERIRRNAEMVKLLKEGRQTYLEIAQQFRVCMDVVIRVAKQNGLQRGPGGRKQAVA